MSFDILGYIEKRTAEIDADKTGQAIEVKHQLNIALYELLRLKTAILDAGALESLRDAIQQAEQLGMVRTESGQVITGAILSDNGIILTEN